jgi:hypothetical protein
MQESNDASKPVEPARAVVHVEQDERHVRTELGLSVPVAHIVAQRGQYTGEQFRKVNPAKYEAVVQLLGMGWRINTIAQRLDVAWETVKAVALMADAQGEIREQKQRFTRLCEQILEEGMEGILLKAKDRKLSALDLKLINEMRLLEAGGATQIVEHRRDPAVEAFKDFLARMGSEGGESLAKGAAGAPGAGGLVAGPVLEAELVPEALPEAAGDPIAGAVQPLRIKEL